jgi:DNA-binding Lrp family transcriptional regulator
MKVNEDLGRLNYFSLLPNFHRFIRAAAETLGISLNTLYNRLNAYEAAGISTAAQSSPTP